MAHGYINHFGGELVSVRSAGVETHGVDPRAINVMKEDGIDISNHKSNHTDDYSVGAPLTRAARGGY
jgi:arsenate reductase